MVFNDRWITNKLEIKSLRQLEISTSSFVFLEYEDIDYRLWPIVKTLAQEGDVTVKKITN